MAQIENRPFPEPETFILQAVNQLAAENGRLVEAPDVAVRAHQLDPRAAIGRLASLRMRFAASEEDRQRIYRLQAVKYPGGYQAASRILHGLHEKKQIVREPIAAPLDAPPYGKRPNEDYFLYGTVELA